MRDLTAEETCAMHHFHDRYAAQTASAVDFYKALPPRDRQFVRDMTRAIVGAAKRPTRRTR